MNIVQAFSNKERHYEKRQNIWYDSLLDFHLLDSGLSDCIYDTPCASFSLVVVLVCPIYMLSWFETYLKCHSEVKHLREPNDNLFSKYLSFISNDWVYLMKVIPETRRVHSIINLPLYYYHWVNTLWWWTLAPESIIRHWHSLLDIIYYCNLYFLNIVNY